MKKIKLEKKVKRQQRILQEEKTTHENIGIKLGTARSENYFCWAEKRKKKKSGIEMCVYIYVCVGLGRKDIRLVWMHIVIENVCMMPFFRANTN